MSETSPPATATPRAALYVDFDNVFMALLRWDERAAYAFGERPDAWLAWLEGREDGGPATKRRTLIRRCYLNPGGYHDFMPNRAVARYRAHRDLRNRTYFGEFRSAFVQAGFDVVDCPPVAYLKNAADMKMALDIREALDHPTRFDEFVLLSGDSDFLPALARLRAHDRRITILAQDTAKAAYLAAADLVVGLDDFAHQGMGNLPIAQFTVAAPPLPQAAPPRTEAIRAMDPASLRDAALAWLREALAASPAGALRATEAGAALARALPALRGTAYAGAGTLGALIEEARDPRLSLTGPPDRRWIYDSTRTAPPGDLPPGVEEPAAPQAPPEAVPQAEIEPEPAPVEPTPPAIEEPEAPPPPPPPPAVPRETLMAEAALLVRDMLWGSRDGKQQMQELPGLAPAEIAFVLGAIAARQPLDPVDYNATSTAIARDAIDVGHLLSPREVAAVLRWLLRGYARLAEPSAPDGALRLGRVLYATLVAAVRAVDEQLTETEKDALRDWAQGGSQAGLNGGADAQ